ncbi:MAG: alpha-1,2-fucosyltransferase, partial [Cyanobacteria bacterium P01_G01_bin.54]
LNRLRSKGKMIVGIHIRRGDYMTEPRLGFTLAFPTKWYCEWLDQTWGELEDPILFLCSDDLDSIVHDFDKFSPVTSKDLAIQLPERLKNLEIEFYIDFFMLSNCDVVVTSNSNFSFVACLLNQRAKLFVRPYWDFSSKFEVFDPWDSDPLLWLENKQPKFFKSLSDTLYVTYTTQGLWAMLKSLFIYFPQSCIKEWAIRAYLGYQINGIFGVIKSLLYTFGCRDV